MPQPIIFPNVELYGYLDSEQFEDLRGWICGKNEIESISVIVNKQDKTFKISYGITREDVRDAYSKYNNALMSGFQGAIDREGCDIGNEIVFEVLLKSGQRVLSEAVVLAAAYAIETLKSVEGMAEFVHGDVPMARSISHGKWLKFLEKKFNKTGVDILEVGSRDVIGASLRKSFSNANYIGFDYYEGENVDVSGDAHKLSTYFPSKKFDLIFSNAVFEHLAMPWIASWEIVKLLKVGGYVFIETHYSYGSHSRPWHFFQFSEEALKILFNPMMGIECIEAGVSNPVCGFFGSKAEPYLKYKFVTGLYCHADFLGKKIEDVAEFEWKDYNLGDIISHTLYPKPGQDKYGLSSSKNSLVNRCKQTVRHGGSRLLSKLGFLKHN